jgi:hypothetical protein
MVEKALTFLERSNDEQRIIVDDADDGTKADWDQPRYGRPVFIIIVHLQTYHISNHFL